MKNSPIGPLASLAALMLAAACSHPAPATEPGSNSSSAVDSAQPASAPAVIPPATTASASSAASTAPAASAEPVPAAPASSELADVAPPLLDDQGQPLGQTEDAPSLDSPFFQRGARALFEAIVKDQPELAKPFFFPVEAYRQVKDIADPDRDHAKRLLQHFERDVHEYHRKLGANAASAEFVTLKVPTERARWMKPGKEGNRLGYHRVTRSSLVYRVGEGDTSKEKSLEVTSLISWRGEWYVVHLHGFE